MISSQRLLMIIIGINLIIGITAEMYAHPTTWENVTQLNTEKDIASDVEQDFVSEEGIWGNVKSTASRLYEGTIGSTIKWGSGLIKIFARGINPFSFSSKDFDTQIEKTIADIIVYIRFLMTILIVFEIYQVFKNRKAS